MRRVQKLLVAGLLVGASLVLILWNTSADAGPPALSVSDAKYQAAQFEGREVSVRGLVVEGSIEQDGGRLLHFLVQDRLEQLRVDFNQTPPDGFGAKEVVLRGTLVPSDDGWVLQAHTIQVGCASKY